MNDKDKFLKYLKMLKEEQDRLDNLPPAPEWDEVKIQDIDLEKVKEDEGK